MSRRYRYSITALALFCVTAAAFSGCLQRETEPEPLSIRGQRIVVWDAIEPSFPDVPSYQASALAVAEDFAREQGVEVEFKFVTRQDIDLYLSEGKAQDGEEPSLVYSTEWPIMHDEFKDVDKDVDPGRFLDAASSYWTFDGKLFGIPAYIHWFGTAVDTSLVPGDWTPLSDGDTWTDSVAGKIGFWSDSPAFLSSVMDWPEVGWTAEKVVSYLKSVKERWGTVPEDPLAAWQDGAVVALSPVTPHLYKWFNSSSEANMRLFPTVGLLEPARYYYTVPGYVVLGEDFAKTRCATLLGELLAQNLGRWATRVLGSVPARIEDAALYHLESGFSYEERMTFLGQLETCSLAAPTPNQCLMRDEVSKVCGRFLREFLKDDLTDEELMSGIRDVLQRHTKP